MRSSLVCPGWKELLFIVPCVFVFVGTLLHQLGGDLFQYTNTAGSGDIHILSEENVPNTACDKQILSEEEDVPADDNEGEYKNPLPAYVRALPLEKLPLPLQVIEQYKKWHSVEALERDPHNRTFAVGYYACPVSAGNRLHEFMNDFLFAILTNRTFLWQYLDTDAYTQISQHQPTWLPLPSLNTAEDCDVMLVRAPWIPSFQEFSERLNLLPTDIDFFHQGISVYNTVLAASKSADNLGNRPPRVVALARHYWPITPSDLPVPARLLNARINILGESFGRGALFRSLFDFSKMVKESVGILPNNRHTDTQHSTYTVALHSRHPDAMDDGCNIQDEISCLRNILSKSTKESCAVWLLSDRACTEPALRDWLNEGEFNCTVEVANHEGAGGSHISEHGPFARIGFFEDVAYAAANARHGFVGSNEFFPVRKKYWLRSSSQLLLELMEFERKLETWLLGRDTSSLPPLDQCMIFRDQSDPKKHEITLDANARQRQLYWKK